MEAEPSWRAEARLGRVNRPDVWTRRLARLGRVNRLMYGHADGRTDETNETKRKHY